MHIAIGRPGLLLYLMKFRNPSSFQISCHCLLSFSCIFSADTIDKLKGKLGSLEHEIKDPSKFKDFYYFTFNYARVPGQKGLGKSCFLHSTFLGFRHSVVLPSPLLYDQWSMCGIPKIEKFPICFLSCRLLLWWTII